MLQILGLKQGFLIDFSEKKFATWVSENERGGSRAVWIFSENSSVLVSSPVPYRAIIYGMTEYREFPNLLATTIAIVSWKWTMLSIADITNYLRQQTSVVW